MVQSVLNGLTPWSEHLEAWEWSQGEHVTLLGPAGCGKTTLAGAILPERAYVLAFACKMRDPTIDAIARDESYRIVRTWDEVGERRGGDRVILWPGRPSRWGLRQADPDEFEAAQYKEFRAALRGVYLSGAWTVWIDELTYMGGVLGLERDIDRLWRQGRSDNISVVAAAQQPVNVPRNTFDQLMHLYLWKMRDTQRIKRCAEISGAVAPGALAESLGRLGPHDVLYVDGSTGETRSTVVTR